MPIPKPHEPKTIEERPTLSQLLDRLDPLQTQRLLQVLVESRPELIDEVDRYVNLIVEPVSIEESAKSPRRRTTIDTSSFRSQVWEILEDAVEGWQSGWYDEEDRIGDGLMELIQEADEFTKGGDARNALAILEAITGTCADGWDNVSDYSDFYEIALLLDRAFAEAILTAELTSEEKVDLQLNLEFWEQELTASFEISSEALRQGWDYPPLQRVLEGKMNEFGAWQGEPPRYAKALAEVRLEILERQERYEEYLYLARAELQIKSYLTMLSRLDRIEEAMEAAKKYMNSMEQAKALAEILREKGALAQALEVARSGLSLQGHCQYALGDWASNLAEGLGDRQVALDTRILAFEARPSLEDYQKIEDLAGDNWQATKAKILADFRSTDDWRIKYAKVEIFLHEGLVEDAIATVTKIDSFPSNLIHQVMDAAINSYPDWVISNAIPPAERIMNRGKTRDYRDAVRWLQKARAAYLAAGRQVEWSAYRAELKTIHGRKYKLMGLFNEGGL